MNPGLADRLQRLAESAGIRTFEFDDFVIVCGRTAEDNQRLSVKAARAGDLWFHSRGVPGSHVLLLRDPQRPFTRQVIELAGILAAHFSKYRDGGLCPVSYCDGAQVERPRGAPVGTVSIRGERVLKVRPRPPEEIPGLQVR